MRRNRALTEAIRMERFEELYHEVEAGRLSCADAAMILGCSPRHFLRLRGRYDEDGLDGLRDRRVGRVSRQRAADAEVEELTRLYRDRYAGFNMRHFHELARRDHSLHRGYSWTRLALLRAGLVTPVKRGGTHRLKRPRKPMRGMMIHPDASTHCWYGEGYADLVVQLDDETSEVTPAFFFKKRRA